MTETKELKRPEPTATMDLTGGLCCFCREPLDEANRDLRHNYRLDGPKLVVWVSHTECIEAQLKREMQGLLDRVGMLNPDEITMVCGKLMDSGEIVVD